MASSRNRSDLTGVDWGSDVIRAQQIPESNGGGEANLRRVSQQTELRPQRCCMSKKSQNKSMNSQEKHAQEAKKVYSVSILYE